MYKITTYILLPSMLINLTVAENRWGVFGSSLDQYIYAATIGLSWYVGSLSRYRLLVSIALLFAIAMRLLGVLGGGESLREIGLAALAVVFAVAGAMIYGRNPFLLHKQLVIYLALCIPIMLLQILGVSSLLMGWNIGYLHDALVLTQDNVGSFQEIPLYPTLFVQPDDLVFSIGQGRPVGLMYGNNPLSFFISIAVAINLTIARTSRICFSDIVVTVATVLAMSKLAFGITILLYLHFLVFGVPERRLLVLKLISVLTIVMSLYYILFPGLFVINLSEDMVMTSIVLRLVDLLKGAGIEIHFGQIIELGNIYKPSKEYVTEEGYSFIGSALHSNRWIPLLFVLIIGTVLYVYRVQSITTFPTTIYTVTLVTYIATQFATSFIGTPSSQIILGFILFPLLKKIWTPMRAKMHVK